jgi:hypothetical protein
LIQVIQKKCEKYRMEVELLRAITGTTGSDPQGPGRYEIGLVLAV